MDVKFLRNKYPRFIYQRYQWGIQNGKHLEISFDFLIEPDIRFQPKLRILNINPQKIKEKERRIIDNLVFHLGLMEILSYWKATCSPEIIIRAGYLNKEQIYWWKDLIINGLGQFFYENKVDFKKSKFLNIKIKTSHLNGFVSSLRPPILKGVLRKQNKILIPIGGGKDSIVSLELLKNLNKKKENKFEIKCFSLNPENSMKRVMEKGGCSKPIIVEREIDNNLLILNRKRFLNGHTPFSAYLAFLTVISAFLFDCKFIILSNEYSSNEGNLRYLGKEINHQYSKSFDFEKKFRKYTKKYLLGDIEYFSLLRPLYEIQISRIFSRYPKFFSLFLSCNKGRKTFSGTKTSSEKWCGKCPKCLFVFTSLYPWIGEKGVGKIFNNNLFKEKKVLHLMLQLIGEEKFKPFECVGTKKESLTALYLSYLKAIQNLKRFKNRKKIKLPFLLEYFEDNILWKYPQIKEESEEIMNFWNSQHCLPDEFEILLKRMKL